jgi:hypothetical protein
VGNSEVMLAMHPIWASVDALAARHTREQARAVVVLEASRLPDADFTLFMRRLSSALVGSRNDALSTQYWFTLADLAAADPGRLQPWLPALCPLAFDHLRVLEAYDACTELCSPPPRTVCVCAWESGMSGGGGGGGDGSKGALGGGWGWDGLVVHNGYDCLTVARSLSGAACACPMHHVTRIDQQHTDFVKLVEAGKGGIS